MNVLFYVVFSLSSFLQSETSKHCFSSCCSFSFRFPFLVSGNIGLDVLRWNFRENNSPEKRDKLALELVKCLQGRPWWRRHVGRDHVLVLGKIPWDFRRSRDDDQWGNRLLHLPEMKSVTRILIECHPWDMNEIGVAHPTFFHPRSDEDIWQWKINGRSGQARDPI